MDKLREVARKLVELAERGGLKGRTLADGVTVSQLIIDMRAALTEEIEPPMVRDLDDVMRVWGKR